MQKRPHQRRFSGAVLSDDTEIISFFHSKGKVLHQGLSFISERQPVTDQLRHNNPPLLQRFLQNFKISAHSLQIIPAAGSIGRGD